MFYIFPRAIRREAGDRKTDGKYRQAIHRGYGSFGLDLMERAGQGVYRAVEDILSDVRDKKAVIVCGKGNNGGDGFVVGRLP